MTGTKYDVEIIAAGESTVLRYADGSVIFRPGDVGDCAYIVKTGRVEMRAKGRALEALEPGEILGGLSLIDRQPQTTSAVASGPAELIPIDRNLFNILLRDDPDFALTVLRLTARSLRATMDVLKTYLHDAPDVQEMRRPEARAVA